MADDIMIAKRNGERMNIKVKKRGHNSFNANDYQKIMNPRDPNDLSIFFEDINLLYNSPIEKAFSKYRDKKTKGFPF